MLTEKVGIVANFHYCKLCDYKTCKKFNFNKHLETAKHKKLTNTYKNVAPDDKIFICICGKNYKHKQSLYNHKKICNYINNDIINDMNNDINNDMNNDKNNDDNDINNEIYINYKENKKDIEERINNEDNNMVINNKNYLENLVVQLITENNEIKNTLIKENQELRQQITELIPKVGNNNNTTINNKFNINVFLNEKCKDAMSIQEFIKNVEISFKNLLTTKSKNIGIGINEIICENMNKLSIYQRPIHCTDKKRETLYIKNDTWEKDVDKTHTTNMLKALQSQQFKAMKKWISKHPNYNEDKDLKHEYMILVNKCSSSLNEYEKKLFKNICECTYLKDDNLLE